MRAMAVGAVVGMAFAAMGTAMARSAEDDLAVVKRAVQVAPAVDAAGDDAVARRIEPRRSSLSARDLRWFKVRVTEKGKKNARVNINLPIALVRALGDDFPIDIGRHVRGDGWRGDDWRDGERRSRSERVLRLGEVLATLEAGQSLVEIDDDEATVRVWVE